MSNGEHLKSTGYLPSGATALRLSGPGASRWTPSLAIPDCRRGDKTCQHHSPADGICHAHCIKARCGLDRDKLLALVVGHEDSRDLVLEGPVAA